ncbi:MAG: hypothetical protein COB08_012730 [Rhodobacteraceae bacterium]|nr:hypothetical protein [Paracoccaceae bacterium]
MKAILTAILFVIATSAHAGGGLANQLSGAWRGVGVQDGAESWLILLEVGAMEAQAAYPEIPCGAIWIYGPEFGGSLSAVEQLTYGKNVCIDGSMLKIESPSYSRIIVSWVDQCGIEIGFAVLHRDVSAYNNRSAELAETTLTQMSRPLGLSGRSGCVPLTS